jgi:hypothetical protein
MLFGRGSLRIAGISPVHPPRPAPIPQMMLTSNGVFHPLGPQGQNFDKYSELAGEGKRYSYRPTFAQLFGGG